MKPIKKSKQTHTLTHAHIHIHTSKTTSHYTTTILTRQNTQKSHLKS